VGTALTVWDKELIESLAERFATKIPNEELSMAMLQGFLMRHKGCPEKAADVVDEFVASVMKSE
jgi:chaperone BCS1